MKAIIFDLDGTLLNTLEDLAAAVNHSLAAHGYPTHSTDAIRSFIGNGAKRLIASALPEGTPMEREREILAGFRRYYDEHNADFTQPYPGIIAMLDGLAERGIKMAILSNKPHSATVDIVNLLLSGYDFACVFGEREGIPRKPDPQSALEVAGILGEQPADIAYVGDSGGDMQTALNAGMLPIGVAWGFRSVEELKREGAVYVLDEPNDMIELIDGGKL